MSARTRTYASGPACLGRRGRRGVGVGSGWVVPPGRQDAIAPFEPFPGATGHATIAFFPTPRIERLYASLHVARPSGRPRPRPDRWRRVAGGEPARPEPDHDRELVLHVRPARSSGRRHAHRLQRLQRRNDARHPGRRRDPRLRLPPVGQPGQSSGSEPPSTRTPGTATGTCCPGTRAGRTSPSPTTPTTRLAPPRRRRRRSSTTPPATPSTTSAPVTPTTASTG